MHIEPKQMDMIDVLDGEFDAFELTSDLEMQLLEVETSSLFHDSFNPED